MPRRPKKMSYRARWVYFGNLLYSLESTLANIYLLTPEEYQEEVFHYLVASFEDMPTVPAFATSKSDLIITEDFKLYLSLQS